MAATGAANMSELAVLKAEFPARLSRTCSCWVWTLAFGVREDNAKGETSDLRWTNVLSLPRRMESNWQSRQLLCARAAEGHLGR